MINLKEAESYVCPNWAPPFWTVHREKILSNLSNYVVTKFGNEYPVYELRKLLKELNESGETSRLFLSILKVRKDFELFGRFY